MLPLSFLTVCSVAKMDGFVVDRYQGLEEGGACSGGR